VSAFRLLCALALALAGAGLAQPALAQTMEDARLITAGDPEAIADVVRGKGFDVEVTKDNDGDPMLQVEGKGYKFAILFYGCTNHRDCVTLGLYAGWTGSTADLAKINKWNKDNRFGRAYIDDENDPVVEMDIDLDDGGMSRLLFEDHIEFWMSVMSQYSKYIFD
jgi:hypothetical protein